jgi:hypothetical protein
MEGTGFRVGNGGKGGENGERRRGQFQKRSPQGTVLVLASAALEPPKPNNELVGRVLFAFFPSSFLLK